jgi:plasmid maintenance system antidote protein VapI
MPAELRELISAAYLGPNTESWLAMQYNYHLWQAKRKVKLGNVGKVKFTAA